MQTFVEREFLTYMWNSTLVALFTTLFSLIIGTLAGYALARFSYPGRMKYHVSFWILSTRMIPPIVTIMPLYIFFSFLGFALLAGTGSGLTDELSLKRAIYGTGERDIRPARCSCRI